jgi:hypothetical protein
MGSVAGLQPVLRRHFNRAGARLYEIPARRAIPRPRGYSAACVLAASFMVAESKP